MALLLTVAYADLSRRVAAAKTEVHQTMHITRHRSKTGMGSERKVSPWLIGALCLGLGLGLGAAGIGLARRQTGLPAEELERLTVEVGRSP